MCNVKKKPKVITVIIGATETISKSFRKYLNYTPGKHDITEIQNTAILDTAHILRKVLMSKYKTFIVGILPPHMTQQPLVSQGFFIIEASRGRTPLDE
jgi:hypothetical protein